MLVLNRKSNEMTREELINTLEIAIETRSLDIALKMLLVMTVEELKKNIK